MSTAQLRRITAEEVQASCRAAGITRVDHHTCSICNYMCCYIINDDAVFFDGNCNCSRVWRSPSSRSWQDPADWINMQSTEAGQAQVLALFGFSTTSETSP